LLAPQRKTLPNVSSMRVKRVTTETLVLIDNRNGNKILAVCRRGMGSNDALKTDYYNPGVAYAKMGKGASTAKEFYGFSLVVIGDVTDGVIKQNRVIIAPASPVYIFPEDFNPMRLLSKSNHTLGYYATGTPTAQNQKRIEEDLRAIAPQLIRLPRERATWRFEQAIRNYDPCISCATHFLRLEIEEE